MTAASKTFSHRSTLKQSNKKFKSSSSKSTNSKNTKSTKSSKKVKNSKNSKNHKKSLQKASNKILALGIEDQKSLYSGLDGIPINVIVIPLCSDVTPSKVLQKELFIKNQKLLLLSLDRDLLSIADALQTADKIIFLLSALEEVDDFGDKVISLCKTIGTTSITCVVQHLECVAEKKHEVKKSLLYYISTHFPSPDIKLFSFDEFARLERHLSEKFEISTKLKNPYINVTSTEIISNNTASSGDIFGAKENISVRFSGYVRGNKISANRLIHIPEYGDFRVKVITDTQDNILSLPNHNQDSLIGEMEVDDMNQEQTWPTDLEIREADELVSSNALNINNFGDNDGIAVVSTTNVSTTNVSATRRVPKGTSLYQASWIPEDDLDENEVDVNQEMGDIDSLERVDGNEENEEYEDIVIEDDKKSISFNEPSDQDSKAQLEAYKTARESLLFPDEIDTPLHIPASQRFARYKGMKSMRNSPWDEYENLPANYSRIFRFGNFKRSKKRAMAVVDEGLDTDTRILDGNDSAGASDYIDIDSQNNENDGKIDDEIKDDDDEIKDDEIDGSSGAKNSISNLVPIGTKVIITLENVPRSFCDRDTNRPLTIFSLFEHEHKMSIMNFTVNRCQSYQEPVKSKDPMILICGFRRYIVHPLYSTYTRGGPNNVHKFERYLTHGKPSMATVYAPIQFATTYAILYKPGTNWGPESTNQLVGSGTLLDPQPLRIMAKRILLTGHPFKIHKHSSVIRFMFFSPEDVDYFRPVQLSTKYGRIGHIKESLGTHGYMKCQFDGVLQGQDTVCMALYKRVFPKWDTSIYNRDGHPLDIHSDDDDDHGSLDQNLGETHETDISME